MAGAVVKHDHAIDKHSDLKANYYKNFRFTPRFAITAITGLIIIPGLCIYTFAQQDAKWDWRGKKRGESLAKGA